MPESDVGRPVLVAVGLPVHLGMLADRMLDAEGWALVQVEDVADLAGEVERVRPRHLWWGPDVDHRRVQAVLADGGYAGGASAVPVPLNREAMASSLGSGAPMAVLDESRLDGLAKDLGGGDMVRELVELFLASLDERWTEAESAWTVGDTEVASRAAHTLKSSSALLGLEELSATCAVLESAAAGPAGLAGPGPLQLRDVRHRAAGALEAWLRRQV